MSSDPFLWRDLFKGAPSLFYFDSNRRAILDRIKDGISSPEPIVRTVIYEAMTEIAENNYRGAETLLGDWMEQFKTVKRFNLSNLSQLTLNAIEKEEDEVAEQAIEFWSTLCEVEVKHSTVSHSLSSLVRFAHSYLFQLPKHDPLGVNEKEDYPVPLFSNSFVFASADQLTPLLLSNLAKRVSLKFIV